MRELPVLLPMVLMRLIEERSVRFDLPFLRGKL
jgi:hypothetical protein